MDICNHAAETAHKARHSRHQLNFRLYPGPTGTNMTIQFSKHQNGTGCVLRPPEGPCEASLPGLTCRCNGATLVTQSLGTCTSAHTCSKQKAERGAREEHSVHQEPLWIPPRHGHVHR